MRRALALLMLVGTTSALAVIALGAREPAATPHRWAAERPAEAGGAARRRTPTRRARPLPRVVWRASVALGTPSSGRLRNGVKLPVRGAHFATWDPVRKRTPNRWWRR